MIVDPFATDLGLRLASLRVCFRESQEQLARYCGVAVATVSRWERGQSTPRAEHLVAISKHWGVPTGVMLGRHQEPLAQFLATADGQWVLRQRSLRWVIAAADAWPVQPPTVSVYELLGRALIALHCEGDAS